MKSAAGFSENQQERSEHLLLRLSIYSMHYENTSIQIY